MADQRFIDEEELEGRTIAKVILEEHRVYMSFTDGTWTCLAPDYGWYGSWDMLFLEDGPPPTELGVDK